MPIQYRSATQDDYPAIIELIKELALFEKSPDKVTNSVDQMKEDSNYFEAIVAEDSEANEVVGMALYFYAYYTWVGKSLYLDDLYVKESHRGRGIGKKLLNMTIAKAKETKCKRIRWQVLDWNQPAIDIYESIGADLDSEWINCDILLK